MRNDCLDRIHKRNFTVNDNAVTKKIADDCRVKLDFSLTLPDEYFYQSLPLCIIDAVFSIAAHYTSTQNTVHKFCKYFNITPIHSKERFPVNEQLSIAQFLKQTEKFSSDELADQIYCNHQRTSTKNGILKAQAVTMFAEVLQKYQVDFLQDVEKIIGKPDFENEINGFLGKKAVSQPVIFICLPVQMITLNPIG